MLTESCFVLKEDSHLLLAPKSVSVVRRIASLHGG